MSQALQQAFADQPDVFIADALLTMGPGVKLPIRSTILRHEGRLAILSPVHFTDDQARAIDALGKVEWLIAPNLYHHLFLTKAKARWPGARIAAPRGLEKKEPALTFDAWLEDGSPFPALIQTQPIAGVPMIGEHTFIHAASKTLIVTDLLFHVLEASNFATWMMLHVVSGALGRCAPSRMWRWLCKDKAARDASLDAVLRYDFDKMIPAHGLIVTADAHALVRTALAELR
jgi:hypothetical protein